MLNNKTSPHTTIIIKAIQWPLFVFYALLCIATIIATIEAYVKQLPFGVTDIFFYLIFHVLILFFWYVVSKMEVHLTEDAIIFKTAFKTIIINWSAITASTIAFFFTGNSAGIHWVFVYDDDRQRKKVFEASYFPKKSNQQIAKVLVEHCSNARIDMEIQGMAKGYFPWYFLW